MIPEVKGICTGQGAYTRANGQQVRTCEIGGLRMNVDGSYTGPLPQIGEVVTVRVVIGSYNNAATFRVLSVLPGASVLPANGSVMAGAPQRTN
jgi:hypothetical protein